MNNDVVNAINAYYKDIGLAEYYADLSETDEGDAGMSSQCAKKYFLRASKTRDYILMRFRDDIEKAPDNIKELHYD